MDISIIIVNYNTKDFLKGCIKSIIENPPSITYEIIVVDNNSTDGSTEMIKKNFSSVRLIACRENHGYGSGINLGYGASYGNHFLILNSDTRVLPTAIDKLYQFMQRNKDAGIVAPKLLNHDLSWQPSCRKFPGLWQDFRRAAGIHRLIPLPKFKNAQMSITRDEHIVRDTEQPMGACLLVRKKALNGEDPFDPQFYMYYEEVDLCYRLKKNNWNIYYVPDANVIHYVGKSFQKNMVRMIYHKYRSRFFFYKKHYSMVKQAGIYLLTTFEMVYRTVVYMGQFFLSSRNKESARARIKGYLTVLSAIIYGKLPDIR